MATDQSVKQLTTAALAIAAPDEVFLVDSYDPGGNSGGATARGPQGFGASEAIVLLLPFVHSFFAKYVEAWGSEAGKKTFSAVAEWLGKKDEGKAQAAKKEIGQVLLDSGMPAAAVEKAAEAIAAVLAKR